MGFGKTEIAVIPAWTYAGKEPSIYTFFESIALADLEEKTIKLSAEDQRLLLGYAVFGRRMLVVHTNGTVEGTVGNSFGRDFESVTWQADRVQAAVAARKELHPSVVGRRYFHTQAETTS